MKKITLLIMSLISIHCAFSQENELKFNVSGKSGLQSGNSKGNLLKQFEFEITADGTVAIASDGQYFYIGRHLSPNLTKYDFEGNQVGDNFTINGLNKLTSLTYDGRYFWGAQQSKKIYKIDMIARPPAIIDSINTPVTALQCTFDFLADDGNGGLWIGEWDSDLVLINLAGTELSRIPASSHGLYTIIATALDNITQGGPYLWTINSAIDPPILRQHYMPSGIQTGESFNLYTEGFTPINALGGGMFIMPEIVPGTTTFVVLTQNYKVFGFDIRGIAGIPFDIGVSSLDLPYFVPNNEIFTVSGTIRNYGTAIINSFRISYQIDGGEIFDYDITGVSMAENSYQSFTCPETNMPGIGNHTISVWTSLPNGEEDEFPGNDKIEFSFSVYDATIAKTRSVLIESFTSSTCDPCVAGNNNLKNILAQNNRPYALIKYQMSWPGVGDPYYTEEGGVRRNFYGINSVPWIHLDGASYCNFTTLLQNSDLIYLQDMPAFVELNADYYVEGQTVYAKIEIKAADEMNNENLRLFIAIAERKTTENASTNGEKEFLQVMKKFMPDANGISLGNLSVNNLVEFEQEWKFKGNYRLPVNASRPINHNIEHSVENFGNLTIIAWIQDIDSKVVFQACNGTEIRIPHFFVNYSTISENGTILATTAETQIESGELLEDNTEVYFTAFPYEGYEVKEWKLNGTVIQDNNSNEYILEINGNNTNVTVEFQLETRINNKILSEISLFSNPLKGELNVQSDGDIIEKVMIYNTSGHVVWSVTNIKNTMLLINTNFFSSGLYFIFVQTKTGVVNLKFIVK